MDNSNHIEVSEGLFYDTATGLPYSNRTGTMRQLTGKSRGYHVVDIKGARMAWHNVVYRFFRGEVPDGCSVDHINNQKLDNRIDNLRAIPTSANCAKHRISIVPKSGYKGVYYVKARGNYIVKLHHMKKRYYIGSFDDPVEAQNAYRRAKVDIAGEDLARPFIESLNN